jgi:hypothetical protein
MAWICDVEDRDPFQLADPNDLIAHAQAGGLIDDGDGPNVHHRLMDLVDRGLLGATDPLGTLDQPVAASDRARAMSELRTTAEGRSWAEGSSGLIPTSDVVSETSQNRRKVAVMHGRDSAARSAVFNFLRRLTLEPLEWGELVNLTQNASPYNGDAVAAAFDVAQAVVVVLTPDDVGFLHPSLHTPREREDDKEPTGQARLNVVLEAGMALQSHPTRTVLVEIGRTREISDLAGRNTVRLDGSAGPLHSLANRLETAQCPVQRLGTDWLDASEFAALDALTRESAGFSLGEQTGRPLDQGATSDRARLARRQAQHVLVELATIDRTVELALSNGYWWNVAYEGLPAIQWDRARDVLADEVPSVYHAVFPSYVEADQLNKIANNHAQGGHDGYDESIRDQMEGLRALIAEAKEALRGYPAA